MGAVCGKFQRTPNGRGAENELLRAFLIECNLVEGYETVSSESNANDNNNNSAVVTKKLDKVHANDIDSSATTANPNENHENGKIEISSSNGAFAKYDTFIYRGESLVAGHLSDVYHYFCDNLGGDRFELLEDVDDRRAIFHWTHDFATQGNQNIKARDNSIVGIFQETRSVITESNASLQSLDLNTMSVVLEDAEATSNDPADSRKKAESNASQSLEIAITVPRDSEASDSRSPNVKSIRAASKGTKTGKSNVVTKTDMVRKRDFVIYRSVFKLGINRVCIVAESCNHKLAKKIDDDTVRGTVNLMGILIEELEDEERKKMINYTAIEANAANDPDALINAKRQLKEPLSRITFLISLSPKFSPEELSKLQERDISYLLGEAKVREIVDGARAYFELEENKSFVKFRALAAAPIGEMGWIAQEKSKTDLQLGTNIKHSTHGHGVVRAFDMKGRIHVAYDNGEIVKHEPNEKDTLHVAVQISTRVTHPTRGAGTVKQFDETGRIHVKFDNGEYHRYKQPAWKKKMHEYKLLGTGGALETITLAYRDFEESREKQGRVKFAVGVSTREVLGYLLDYEEDAKTGNIIKNEIVEEKNPFHRIRYQQRKMPPPLTDRDFVYDEMWREVAPLTYIIINKSVEHEAKKSVLAGVVRGMILLSGYLIEPLFTEDGKDHIAQITYMLCLDPQGFIPPDAVAGIRTGQLLGAVTDMRAHFWRRTQQMKSVHVVNRKITSSRSSTVNTLRLSKSQANNQIKTKSIKN